MSRLHMEYEMLCALATAGQLSELELNDLNEHVETCPSCQRRLAQMEAASCAYFLRHASKAKRVDLPPGMQRRFEERAGSMGIPSRGVTSALSGTRLISLALSVVLLTVTAQLGWKILYPKIRERNAVHVEVPSYRPVQALVSTPEVATGEPTVHKGSPGGPNRGRSPRRFRRALFDTSLHPEVWKILSGPPTLRLPGPETFAGDRHLSTPGWNQPSFAGGGFLPLKRTFELTSALRFMALGEDPTAAKPAFRYSPTSASLSFLGVPERAEVPHVPALNQLPPLFHINSPQAW